MQIARQWLERAKNIAVLAGAGLSAESGVPTFRGAQGLWNQFRPEDLATPEAFARDPLLVWQWYDWRRQAISKARPNAAHLALSALEKQKQHFTLITQNVDGLEDEAGCKNVIRLHGNIWILRCTACATEHLDRRVPLPQLPPRCSCGALLRPGVVWFGEPLPAEAWEHAQLAARSADLFMVIGTSAEVFPAASLVFLARSAGARIIEVNPSGTPVSQIADLSLRARAGEILPMLVQS